MQTPFLPSYEAACTLLGKDHPLTVPLFAEPVTDREQGYNALAKVETITAACNGNNDDGTPWEADYSDGTQPKYFANFEWDSAAGAFRVRGSLHGYTHTYTATGARLACRTRAICEHIGKTQIDNFNKFLIKPKTVQNVNS